MYLVSTSQRIDYLHIVRSTAECCLLWESYKAHN